MLARQAFHRLDDLDLAGDAQPESLEAAGGGQYLLFQGAHRLVE